MNVLWLCILVAVGSSHGARILGIFPIPSISHQIPFQVIMKALAARGHQVTVISPNPQKTPIANYTDVDTSFMYEYWKSKADYNKFAEITKSLSLMISTMGNTTRMWADMCDMQLASAPIQDFIKSNQKFDLVFFEAVFTQCLYGLIHVAGSPPVIGILPVGGMTPSYDAMGNPNNPSISPELMLAYTDHMTFKQRTINMLVHVATSWASYYLFMPQQETMLRKYFGDGPPSVYETERNFNLLMVNNHFSLNYPRALLPNVIELGSLHVQHKTKALPKDLQEFLDGAKDGFIYFSLGSNVRSDRMPEQKRQQLLEAFAELPQRVLWKWESDTLPGQPKNVRLGKWLPQQDILAHPNIRLFMTQGGLQSLQEATHNAVPLVAIPFISEQWHNMNKVVSVGAGLTIDLDAATKESITQTLKEVLEKPSYRENMKKLSAINKDQPETPLERAVWWTEYVLRHNGAKHMRSAALDLAWYQYLLLDVVAFIALSLILTVAVIYLVIRKLCCVICRFMKCNKNCKLDPKTKRE